MLYKDIEKLVKLIENSDVDELEWEKNKEKIRLKKTPSGTVAMASPTMPMVAPAAVNPAPIAAPVSSAPAPTAANSAPANSAAAKSAAPSGSGKEVTSPFVGTYYESPAPGAPKYIQVGQSVNKGDVLCIIEAMKIMNEIEAEFSGKVSGVLVKDGQAVQYGQPLFQIEPN